MNRYKKLEDLYLKGADLASEAQKAVAYEQCDYHFVEYGNSYPKQFGLVRIADGKMVANSTDRAKSWMNIRGISLDVVFNSSKYLEQIGK